LLETALHLVKNAKEDVVVDVALAEAVVEMAQVVGLTRDDASTVANLATFLQLAPNQQATNLATIVAMRVTSPETAPMNALLKSVYDLHSSL
jgi:hypothetical protein